MLRRSEQLASSRGGHGAVDMGSGLSALPPIGPVGWGRGCWTDRPPAPLWRPPSPRGSTAAAQGSSRTGTGRGLGGGLAGSQGVGSSA